MNSHKLAEKLLKLPNVPVIIPASSCLVDYTPKYFDLVKNFKAETGLDGTIHTYKECIVIE